MRLLLERGAILIIRSSRDAGRGRRHGGSKGPERALARADGGVPSCCSIWASTPNTRPTRAGALHGAAHKYHRGRARSRGVGCRMDSRFGNTDKRGSADCRHNWLALDYATSVRVGVQSPSPIRNGRRAPRADGQACVGLLPRTDLESICMSTCARRTTTRSAQGRRPFREGIAPSAITRKA